MALAGESPRPSKIVCVGRNYVGHAAELGNAVPAEPLIFLKAPSAIVGPGEPIELPPGVGRVDYEGEIGLVIGATARRVAREDAAGFIRGLRAANDVTARALQRSDSQWSRAKGFDTFCPLGDEVPVDGRDFADLEVVTRVNGEERQRGHSSTLAFDIPVLIEYITEIMTLEPGDVVLTGTPEGVGPLEPGDEVEVEVVGVGSVANPVIARPD